MNLTTRLFDELPYERTFSAIVTLVGEDYIILDKTLFYPLSGNQDFDIGIINGKPVISVSLDCNGVKPFSLQGSIKHFMDTRNFHVGQVVECEIDFDRRLRTMRLHTASHLVEYFMAQLDTFISVEGSFVSSEKDRTDYFLSKNLDSDTLIKLEGRVNDFIAVGHAVVFEFLNEKRFWICNGIKQPCCGTHVSNSLEVGIIKLSRKNKGKGLNRIEIHLQ